MNKTFLEGILSVKKRSHKNKNGLLKSSPSKTMKMKDEDIWSNQIVGLHISTRSGMNHKISELYV